MPRFPRTALTCRRTSRCWWTSPRPRRHPPQNSCSGHYIFTVFCSFGGTSLRVAVSGAAGFIGSHFCDRLIAEGHTVVALDNLITGSVRNIAHLEGRPHFTFQQCDVTRPFSVEGHVDAVAHMASPASPKDYLEHPIETLDVGSAGTRNMLELARAHRARYLLTSTSECYGDPLVHPQSEGYWG